MKNKPAYRLQGTDGVRAVSCLSSYPLVKGLSPLQAFLQGHRITEEFMELYTFACVSYLTKKGECKKGDGFVIGWDPRDKTGVFTEAAVMGVRKAGGKAIVLKIVPTPVVPLYMQYCQAKAGFMITASHNPAGQNGIKIFLSPFGLKPLPTEDYRFTREFGSFDYEQIKKMKPVGGYQDCHDEAVKIFQEFSVAPENTGATDADIFRKLILIIDPANGTYSGIAHKIFMKLGVKEVIEINHSFENAVNYKSGVADLEGVLEITAADIKEPNGRFRDYPAIVKIFEVGRRRTKEISQGAVVVSAAVFDADGDRFFRLDYDRKKDAVNVYSGDDTAYMISAAAKDAGSSLYVNTIESDLNVSNAVKKMSFKTLMTPVGDKWLLLEAAFCQIEDRIYLLKKEQQQKFLDRLKKIRGAALTETIPIRKLADNVAMTLKRKSPIISKQKKKKLKSEEENQDGQSLVTDQGMRFFLGAEESGHNITPGLLKLKDGTNVTVYIGNGLKSAINTYAATLSGKIIPYEKGYKKTYYIYYTDKKKFCRDGNVWKELKSKVKKMIREVFGPGTEPVLKSFPQEPDLFYLLLRDLKTGEENKSIFVRNSGTEDKTGINLRGTFAEREKLDRIGKEIYKFLSGELKDLNMPYAKAEQFLLKMLAHKKICRREEMESEIKNNPALKEVDFERILKEVEEKEELIKKVDKGYRLND